MSRHRNLGPGRVTLENGARFGACWLGWPLDAFDFLLITYVLTDIAKAFDLSLTVAGTLILATFATRWSAAAFSAAGRQVGRRSHDNRYHWLHGRKLPCADGRGIIGRC